MRRTRRRSKVMSVIAGLFCVLFGVIWTKVSLAQEAPGLFAVVGIGIIIMSVVQILQDLNIIPSKRR